MNPRGVKTFLTSRFGLFVVFVAVLFGGVWIFGLRAGGTEPPAARPAASASKDAPGRVQLPLNEGLEDGLPRQAGAPDPAAAGAAEGKIVPFKPAQPAMPAKAEPAAQAGKVHYATLLAAYDSSAAGAGAAEPAPKRFVPYGTLLKCKLVNTVDSANLGTPVIALLTEDVWQNGERVIPANTLVHGTAQAGRVRDRINAAGEWRFVWQDGRELSFSGVALDREYDHEIDGYGITDGSAGLKGEVIASDDLQDIKLLASAALSGFARGTQDQTQTPFGTTITGSLSNGVREGFGEVFDLYARQTLTDIEQNGYFVRVPAGKEFYVYVLQTVDPDDAKVAGAKVQPPAATAEPSANAAPPGAPTSGEPKTKG